MENIVEDGVVVIPLRAFLEHVLVPSFQWRVFLELRTVPAGGVFGETLEHHEGADVRAGEDCGVDPQTIPVVGIERERIWQLIDGYSAGLRHIGLHGYDGSHVDMDGVGRRHGHGDVDELY